MIRTGLSLMEVVISLSILVGGAAVLGQLLAIGEKQSEHAEHITEAQRIAFNKLNEILSGISPLEPVEMEPVRLDSKWAYSIAIQPVGSARMLRVQVSVHEFSDDLPTVDADIAAQPVFQLTRWIQADIFPLNSELLNLDDTENDFILETPNSSSTFR